MDDDFEDEEEEEEENDISAIYVLGKGKFDLCSSEMTEIIRRAFEQGIKEARRKHKEVGVPMVISRDGKIVYIQPEDIELD